MHDKNLRSGERENLASSEFMNLNLLWQAISGTEFIILRSNGYAFSLWQAY
jgi:hypothetical protein